MPMISINVHSHSIVVFPIFLKTLASIRKLQTSKLPRVYIVLVE